MVIQDTEMASQGEGESPPEVVDQEPRNTLGRQPSIYSLTLDEFQNTLCESGKNFGSMNMDEFISSIWSVEENQTIDISNPGPIIINENTNTAAQMVMPVLGQGGQAPARDKGVAGEPSLARQPSLSLPPPLCRKTVEEVWAEIQRGQQQNGNPAVDAPNPDQPAARQQTFGEMTLEDFLVKAGIVCDKSTPPETQPQLQPPPQPQQFGMQQNGNINVGPGFVGRPMMGMPGGIGGVAAFQGMPQAGTGVTGESSGYGGSGQRNACVFSPQPLAVAYGGSFGPGPAIGIPAAMSSMTPDGMCATPVGGTSAGQFGMEMTNTRGRRRIFDGPVEKVVERRHRRMIKNRESAARSRARKQAYTVELEAELNQLKEENTQLKQGMLYYNEVEMKGLVMGESSKKKLMAIRRTFSSPL